jgi:GNAT superfamily N-acetyltransferase
MIEVSPCANEADEHVSLEVFNSVRPDEALTMDEMRSFKSSARDHVDLLARLDGIAVGSAIGLILPERVGRVFAMVRVLPEQRRQGVGSALYRAISAWTSERGLKEIEVPVLDNDSESLAFAKRRGFAEERRELGVVLHLSEITPSLVEPPEGVEIIAWADRPELARGIYGVLLEAEPDIPGFQDDVVEPFEDWLAHHMQGPSDRPEATFLALAADEVVGYAKLSCKATQPTTAYHDLTAVKRTWRGLGVARALKSAQISWAAENGYTELRTRNDTRNEPIRRLNARFGYRPWIGRIYLVGPLA